MAIGGWWQIMHLEVAVLHCLGGSVTAERGSSGLPQVF